MQSGDLAAVVAIEAAATDFPWSQRQFTQSLSAGHDCLVLEKGGCVIGSMVMSRVLDEASLLNIAVATQLQGQGYGRYLLQQGLHEQYEAGARQCFLEVRASNHKAFALYVSLGFKQVGERKNYYPAATGREHALVLCRQLSNVGSKP